MKTKHFFLAAMAGISFAGCSSDDIVAEVPPVEEPVVPIVFNSQKNGITRADFEGRDAANLLGNRFVVSGYKGPKSAWDNSSSNLVFDNFLVVYQENTANTTESNSANWEYVGKGRIKHAIDNGVTQQSIKYWDFSQPQYDFIAWSTGKKTAVYEGTPAAGEVLVSAITPATATGTDDAAAAYTFTGKAADLTDCYIADLVTVKKADYQKAVNLKFRSLGSKVRIGIYETVPGYSVKDVKFYAAADQDLPADNTTPRLFTTAANQIFTEGTYTVYYPTVDAESDADNNQAHIKFAGSGTQSTVVDFGALGYTIAEDGEKTPGAAFLGRTSATATFAGEAEGNYYTQYLPNEAGTNLNLRVDYTLESIDGVGETITVRGATAQVPSIYTQWKAGFAYTYLFKISDKTNGYTGAYNPLYPDDTTVNSDPTGLYPITFDACVVNAEDNDVTQETITLVSTPSITSYQQGSNVVNSDEYTAGNDIFVVVSDGNAETTPDLANSKVQTLTGKAALYTIPVGKTEADVVDALTLQDDDAEEGTVKGRSGLVLTEATSTLEDKVEYGVDGNTISLGTDEVLRFAPTAGLTYAFVYTKKASDSTEDRYQLVTKAAGESVKGLYRHTLASVTGDVQKGVTYFSSYKKDAVTVFLGQSVGNLYLDAAGTTIANGYAATGTDYYYTTDHGMSYTKATAIAYADFASAELYHDAAHTILKTETEPANGQAYYDATGNYCVIYPQQGNGSTQLYAMNTAAYKACDATDKAVKGMLYYDKYTQNNGVYYTKIIKVQ